MELCKEIHTYNDIFMELRQEIHTYKQSKQRYICIRIPSNDISTNRFSLELTGPHDINRFSLELTGPHDINRFSLELTDKIDSLGYKSILLGYKSILLRAHWAPRATAADG